jgi:hypothetical protein
MASDSRITVPSSGAGRPAIAEYRVRQTGPFFVMVSAFTSAIAGAPSIFREDNPMGFGPNETIGLTGIVHPDAVIYPAHIVSNAKRGLFTSDEYRDALCCMLANTSYEGVKGHNDRSPAFEVFRHVRNAASHQNRFHFFDDEPSRPASWRRFTLDESLKGSANPLYGKQCFGSLLGPSDLLLLLADIDAMLTGAAPVRDLSRPAA